MKSCSWTCLSARKLLHRVTWKIENTLYPVMDLDGRFYFRVFPQTCNCELFWYLNEDFVLFGGWHPASPFIPVVLTYGWIHLLYSNLLSFFQSSCIKISLRTLIIKTARTRKPAACQFQIYFFCRKWRCFALKIIYDYVFPLFYFLFFFSRTCLHFIPYLATNFGKKIKKIEGKNPV